MKRLLLLMTLAALVFGCKRECDCPVECGTQGGATVVAAPTATVAGVTVAPVVGSTAAPIAGATAGPAIGATVAPAPLPEKEYCASENGDVFHRCSCNSVKRIKPDKLVRFPSRADAVASGRRPCKHCAP